MAEKTVAELAVMLADKDPETMRAGKRQLWERTRHVGKPGHDGEIKALVKELFALLAKDQPAVVKREAMWMLSELAGDDLVAPVASLLADAELRADACMVLERIPGNQAVDTLKGALKLASDDFKNNITHSLRARGVAVDGPPCAKLKPCRQTEVKPVGR